MLKGLLLASIEGLCLLGREGTSNPWQGLPSDLRQVVYEHLREFTGKKLRGIFMKTSPKTSPSPPKHLSGTAKKLWKSSFDNYAIDEQAAMVLQAGLEALDRREEARAAIAKDGAVVVDRWGQSKPSPWVGIERDAAQTLYKAFRLLGMDLAQAGQGRR